MHGRITNSIAVFGLLALAACGEDPQGITTVELSGQLEIFITTTKVGTDKPDSWTLRLFCHRCIPENPQVSPIDLNTRIELVLRWRSPPDNAVPLSIGGIQLTGNPYTADYVCRFVNGGGWEQSRARYYYSGGLGLPSGAEIPVRLDVTCKGR